MRSLAYHGCKVILACRDVRKGEAAVARLQSQRPSASCHVMHLDLASLTSVRTFAHTLINRFRSVMRLSIVQFLVLVKSLSCLY